MKVSQARKPPKVVILEMLQAPDEYFTRAEVYKEVQRLYPEYSQERISHSVDTLINEKKIGLLKESRAVHLVGSLKAIRALKKAWGIKEETQ